MLKHTDMQREGIVRQDFETSIPELFGEKCEQLLAIVDADGSAWVLYLAVRGVWHRFFLDAALLFWSEGRDPYEEDELLEGEVYEDWAEDLGVKGAALAEISMRECVFTMRFDNGGVLELKDTFPDAHDTVVLRKERGRP